ncbi:MAG: hypothetical protein NC824_00085 [Candidatus Omnitrophica bacterium]|nr:hypothetical protein [Candidatus Omnitrophota bacterium]
MRGINVMGYKGMITIPMTIYPICVNGLTKNRYLVYLRVEIIEKCLWFLSLIAGVAQW